MTFRPRASPQLAIALALLAPATALSKQASPGKDANAIVASAVQSELNADHTDHTAFIYRTHDVTPDHDTLYQVIETPHGNLRRKLEDHGRPLSAEDRKEEDDRIMKLVNDKNAQAKEQKEESHDDEQAEKMLKLLPTAYIWTIDNDEGELVTLNFRPDPEFHPPDMESKVLSAMAGQIVVARGDNRIRTIRGSLVNDVIFGIRLIGHLKKGGTFQVERREVAPHHWQVVESHVKIEGHALFFKSIGSIDDEHNSDYKISTIENLQQACETLTVCKPAGK
jgi:Skp family chaperone for outer membrane proteins